MKINDEYPFSIAINNNGRFGALAALAIESPL